MERCFSITPNLDIESMNIYPHNGGIETIRQWKQYDFYAYFLGCSAHQCGIRALTTRPYGNE